MDLRTGIGFDAHRFAEGRKLVLGGVCIPDAAGLAGHSDADVLSHAITDALLGAVADGDIGRHFPESDPAWKDARSVDLLARVGQRLRDRGVRVVNVDATLIAEAPRLAPFTGRMREALADAIGIGPEDVSVKATTVEGMGALGRSEGIAAMAVATVAPPPRGETGQGT